MIVFTSLAGRSRIRSLLAIGAVSVIVVSGLAMMPKTEQRPDGTLRVKLLMTRDDDLRRRVVDDLLGDRKALIRELITIVDPANKDKYTDETRSAAGYLLGEFRAVEAVRVLSDALLTEPPRANPLRMSRYGSPFQTALIKIGRPAIPAMIQNLETSDDRSLRWMSLGVSNRVVGGKRRLLELLGRLTERASDEQVRQRLQRASNFVEEHFREDEEPLF